MDEVGSSKQEVTLAKVDEMEEHVAVEQELEEDESPPPRELGRLDAELKKVYMDEGLKFYSFWSKAWVSRIIFNL